MPLNIVRSTQLNPEDFPDWIKPLDLHPVIKRLYLNRGINRAEEIDCGAAHLLNYQLLAGIEPAVALLVNAFSQQRKIIVVGDFDADGATSTALCLLALTEMGAYHVDHLVPNRFEYGYGLTPEIVDVAHQQGAQLIITVDNGISCHAGVAHAKALGMEVLITDHHLPAETLPDADAIVNPNQPECHFPSKMLAGVGVAFYLMVALRAKLKDTGWFEQRGIAQPNLASYLDLVALGTVADVVPLDRNNRILVHQGLQRIRAGKCRPGILAMLEVANKKPYQLNASDLGFVLGPRLNAAGRLDDMSLGIACLLANDSQHARSLAMELDRLNQERKHIEHSMQQEALAALESVQLEQQLPLGLVIYQADFHAGVIGIVAGRLKDKMHRPTVVFAEESDQVLKGSARSVKGIHIRDVLEAVNSKHPQLIIKFGGHAMAAGLSLQKHNLDAFNEAFNQQLAAFEQQITQTQQIQSDGELPGECLALTFAEELGKAGPWGQGFSEPIFDGHFFIRDQRIVGEKHLKMLLSDSSGNTVDAIAFNVDRDIWPKNTTNSVQMAYKLDVNEFRNQRSVQLIVEALE